MTNQAAAQSIFDATSTTLEQLGWSAENAHKAAEKAMRVAFPSFTASRGEGQVYELATPYNHSFYTSIGKIQ